MRQRSAEAMSVFGLLLVGCLGPADSSSVAVSNLELRVCALGSGSVTVSDSGLPKDYPRDPATGQGTGDPTCSSASRGCYYAVERGTRVTLTPVPDAGKVFIGWSGDACAPVANAPEGVCTVTMGGERSVAAAFGASGNPSLVLTVAGRGTVRTPAAESHAIDCGTRGSVCVAEFGAGSVVTLIAVPEPGQTLVEVVPGAAWTPVPGATDASCAFDVTMGAAATSVTVRFTGVAYGLQVSLSGAGISTGRLAAVLPQERADRDPAGPGRQLREEHTP